VFNFPKLNSASLALIIGNLVPIIGVLFFEWQLFPLILIYWLENVVIGIFNAFKMLTCSGSESFSQRIFMTMFFSVHYGMFCFGHGTFVVDLFGGEFREMSVSEVMFSPYKRIIVLHVFIIFGGMVLQALGVTQIGLIILAMIKIAADLMSHKIEHKKK
jgi:hypothetical protein